MGSLGSDRFTKFMMWLIALCVVGGTIYALRYVRGYRPLMGLGFLNAGDLPADIALRFDNVHVAYREHNQVAWKLQAGRVETNRQRSRLVFAHGITATLMDGGKPRAIVVSSEASYDTTMHVLDVTGKSVCHVFPKGAQQSRPGDDLTIEAQEIVWSTTAQTVLCRGAVHVTQNRADLRGSDLSVNLQTRDFSLSQFHADFEVDETKNVQDIFPVEGFAP